MKKHDEASSQRWRGRGRGRVQGRGRGHSQGRGRGEQFTQNHDEMKHDNRPMRGRERGGYNRYQEKKDVECYNCHKYGHFSWECRNEYNNEKTHYVEEVEKDKEVSEVSLMACNVSGNEKDRSWYLDSGASNHMCGSKHMFIEIDESVTRNISFGDMSRISIKGKGRVLFKSKSGAHQFIENVYYVPGMKTNILSIGQLLEKGYDVHMKDRHLYLKNGEGALIASVPMTNNRMFLLNIQNDVAKCLKACYEDQSWLWHLRLGHINFGGIKMMSTKKVVKGLPSINHPDQVCQGCLTGKQSRLSFPKESMSRANEPLELIHTDICGPIEPASLGGNRYFITFIDDFSRKTWVYFLKQKSEAFSIFKRFKALVEKQSGVYIKAMRSDRGGEFNSSEFKKFCDDNGIRRPLTVAYSPQQNGVAEQKNRSIMNMVRCMLKSKHFPKEF